MSKEDFSVVCSKIDEEKEFLDSISQSIWKNPELHFEEKHAHHTLTAALEKYGFHVQKHYLLNTAFRAEYSSKTEGGPVIAVMLEYDALPDIGHACGHNLIAELGLAAGIGIKAAMDADSKIAGKLLLLGTPAEERKGGKIKLLEMGAFQGIDAAMMVHPANGNRCAPTIICRLYCKVDFTGKEAHASAYPWRGCNALDAAVAAYQNLALLRQQIKPTSRIHVIITKGGTATNIIPAAATLELGIRTITLGELKNLRARVTDCITSGAVATGCSANIQYDDAYCYENLITNSVMGNLYLLYAEALGLHESPVSKSEGAVSGSSDMGNVSHVIPSIHPFYCISSKYICHTKEFTGVAGSPDAQEPTLAAGKALAMTALRLMKCPKTLEEVKKQFQVDIFADK